MHAPNLSILLLLAELLHNVHKRTDVHLLTCLGNIAPATRFLAFATCSRRLVTPNKLPTFITSASSMGLVNLEK